ncbi:MAG: DegV family protein [Ruminococcus sp.]|uniref:DegV family protein n=1 Tax=Ruminococcus sp. TaxID=41978 RepID=UPI00292F5140|nr:DegV family protein [uncultured Ruminococcus sp.]MBQ4238251.1 DegV family protein [Ruminococcus sp.]
MSRIIITADSTADIPAEIAQKYNIRISPLHVLYDDEDYADGVDITPEYIIERYEDRNQLPSTSAVTPEEYRLFFKQILREGYDEIVHIAFCSDMSSTYQNAVIAAGEFDEKIYVVDSRCLSVGMMLLAIRACEFRDMGFSGERIADIVKDLTERNIGGFLLSQLEFLHKGGRCSSVSLLGANLLNIKPSIVVKDGAMSVAKKYRGKDEMCRLKYMKDRIAEYEDRIDTSRIVLHTTCDLTDKERKMYKKELKKLIKCDEIIVSTAGCVITSHCGPGTFSLFFMLK